MPAEPSAFRSPYSQRSTSEASTPSARGSFSGPHMGPSASAPAPPIPQPSGTMSIGSIIEPNMHRSSEYASDPSGPGGLHELSGHTPIGTTPRSLVPELLYGLSPSGDSPLYSSSDSCYSPLSDYLQPQQALPQPYYPQEDIQRPEHGSIDSCFQPISVHSPLSAGAPPPTPSWGHYDHAALGFPLEPPSLPGVSDDEPWLNFRDVKHRLMMMVSIDNNTSSNHPHGKASLLTRWAFHRHTSHGNGRK